MRGENTARGRFSKVLVANRGEIAVRIFRTLRELGIGIGRRLLRGRPRLAPRRASPTRRTSLGPGPAAESYLDRERLLEAAAARRAPRRSTPATASSPRTPASRAPSRSAGLVWIGPPPEAIERDGLEDRGARAHAAPPASRSSRGRPSRSSSADEVVRARRRARLAARDQGVGGRRRQGPEGRRAARTRPSAHSSRRAARAQAYFADATVYVERYLEDPRHVEVQVLADAHGNVIHLGERDCTIQRRHQKLVEETPSPAVDARAARADRRRSPSTPRARSATAAPGRSRACSSRDGEYFFLEMNTRIQVEHTVTELVTGLDLVREQVLIAAGEPLSLRQEDVRLTRARDRVPDQRRGSVQGLPARRPGGSRATASRRAGRPRRLRRRPRAREVSALYDPMVAKLIVHGVDREHARRRMLRALDEFEIGGITTLLGFHRALLSHPCFVDGETCPGVVESEELAERAQRVVSSDNKRTGCVGRLLTERATTSRSTARSTSSCCRSRRYRARAARERRRRRHGGPSGRARCRAVLDVASPTATRSAPGQVICIVEAMKMENEITRIAPGLSRGSRSRRASRSTSGPG